MINFGSILNDTSKKVIITMSNISVMGLNYEWNFVEEELVIRDDQSAISGSRDSKRDKSGSMVNMVVPINEIFDILPLSGYL